MRTMRGCSDKTPECIRLLSSPRERKRKEQTRHAHARCLRLLCYTCMRYIFLSVSVIAQTVLIYIICVSPYLRMLSNNA